MKPLDALCRRAVIAALDRLQGGEILLKDPHRELRLGAVDPSRPLRAQLVVHDPATYRQLAFRGSIGASQAYGDGTWDSDDLTALFQILVRRIGHESPLERRLAWLMSLPNLLRHLGRRNTKANSRANIHAHYDLGNEFFSLFLDESMTYSCGFFEHPEATLEQASEAKLRRLCRKLELNPGHHVLEIGSGWGSFALMAAKEFGCRVTTTTISRQQHALASSRIQEAGLQDRVEVLLKDYRDLQGKFDRIVSIEMIEAVGHENLPRFFAKCAELLRPQGAMAVQAITMPDQRYAQYVRSVDFIRHVIFPGSCCPSRTAMQQAMTRASDLRLVDLEEIGPHYATTLRLWRERFVARREEARALGYPERLLRLWEFYLRYCEAGFAERHVGDVQMVLAKPRWSGAVPRGELASKETVWR
ncbi:MAG: cyclopropane-fatty-acyl-phospholipid synthase family protein [Fimbriimonadaceae bacterium]|nr:cyclopropane-fatty-acyl-phospholipid synthase family protein [Fimbriimonadaceae bacterium]